MDEDYSTLSNKDLSDLKELTKKAIDHYDSMINNQDLIKKAGEGYKMELELCKKYTLEDLETIEKEIESRNKK
jgi:hypothetical protein